MRLQRRSQEAIDFRQLYRNNDRWLRHLRPGRVKRYISTQRTIVWIHNYFRLRGY